MKSVDAWEVLDSRGNPTVACRVILAGGGTADVIVPSGASTGTYEALELRDGGSRFGGRGVRRAAENVNEILGPAVLGMDATDQCALDERLVEADGDPRFSRLGANAALAVSLAAALAAASNAHQPAYRYFAGDNDPLLPLPMVNIISGGAHAGGAIDVQDLLVVPIGASSFSTALEWVWRVRAATAQELAIAGHPTALVADEGGLAAPFTTNALALEVLRRGIERAGLTPGRDVAMAIDIAANQFHRGRSYQFQCEGRTLSASELIDEVRLWCDAYPIVSVEDVLADEDDRGWEEAGRRLGDRVQLLGDDLFVTDEQRLRVGAATGSANSVLVKPNQAGCLTAARRVIDVARSVGFTTVLSARSGETEDSWLADLACGWRTGQIKVGSTVRSERTAKWNRLLRIERDLGGPDVAPYAGSAALPPQCRIAL